MIHRVKDMREEVRDWIEDAKENNETTRQLFLQQLSTALTTYMVSVKLLEKVQDMHDEKKT